MELTFSTCMVDIPPFSTCMLDIPLFPHVWWTLVMGIGNIFKIDDRYINIDR